MNSWRLLLAASFYKNNTQYPSDKEKILFSHFPNCHWLTILSIDSSSFSNKHINFAVENVKSSLVQGDANRAEQPRWSIDMKSINF